MRHSGILKTWNDDRGFGFITPTNGSIELFVHISALPRNGTRPTTGERLTYEIARGKDGKPKAVNVIRVAFGNAPKSQRPYASTSKRKGISFSRIGVMLIVVALVVFGFEKYKPRSTNLATTEATMSFESTQSAKSDATPINFSCDGRKYCSQMTSCTEAKLFLKNCPGTEMDGNNDGVPCERQWCVGE